MKKEIFESSYHLGQKTHLQGYTSTTTDKSTAINFALKNLEQNQIPLILKIEFKGQKGLFSMSKGQGYSAYDDESEVIVQDGLQYLVTHKESFDFDNDQRMYYIELKYPANNK